jgi:hypothetical protein
MPHDDLREQVERVFAEGRRELEDISARPRRSPIHLFRNMGAPNALMLAAATAYVVSIAVSHLYAPITWYVLGVIILAATVPRLFINEMVNHQPRMNRFWSVGRRTVFALLILDIFNVLPSSVLVSGAIVTLAAAVCGTMAWTMADTRVVSTRRYKVICKEFVAQQKMKDRLAAHAQAHPPRDPDDSVYRRVP